MSLPRVRFSVRWLMVAVAAFAILLWAVMMAQKPIHYWTQAQNHARLEDKHRQEERRYRTLFGDHGLDDIADSEAEEADRHGRLKTQYRRLATHPWEDPPPNLPLPFPWDRDRDRNVLETVLADLMDPGNPENAIDFRTPDGAPCPEIVLGETNSPRGGDSDDEDGDGAWVDFHRRNSNVPILMAGIGLGGFQKVHYDDPSRLFEQAMDTGMAFSDYFHKQYPLACNYARVTLPGYSRDGRRAVVSLSCGWGQHPVSWTYELELTDAGWRVKERGRHFSE